MFDNINQSASPERQVLDFANKHGLGPSDVIITGDKRIIRTLTNHDTGQKESDMMIVQVFGGYYSDRELEK